ncbi:unnamed protein product [Closterium sp. NIES-65]|nr:unnamed protein product [Closterium sp. NIES-65]
MQIPPDPAAASATPLNHYPEPGAMALASGPESGALAADIAIPQAGSGESDLSRADNPEGIPRLEGRESTRLPVDASQHICWTSGSQVLLLLPPAALGPRCSLPTPLLPPPARNSEGEAGSHTTPGGAATAAVPSEAAAAPAAAAAAGRGVVVGGRGCSGCVQGVECSIHVWVMPPAYWVSPLATNRSDADSNGNNRDTASSSNNSSSNDESSWLKDDLTLTLKGPALGSGDVQCTDPPSCSHFLISYRLWDVGDYSATLSVGCSNLNFSPDFAAYFNSTFRHDLATWSLSIGWPEQSASGGVFASAGTDGAAGNGAADMGAGGSDAATSATAASSTTSPSSLATPCTPGSIPGRWKKDSSGNYTWTFFPCAPPLSPPSRWISDLRRKGIEEINIVGNSHQRGLANHLHFLLSGSTGNTRPDPRFNYTFRSSNEKGETFRINFYWVDGIYRNGEFHCGDRGITSNRPNTFPDILSRTADVTIMNAGSWTDRYCGEPIKAFRAHLPEFLNWGLQFAAQNGKPLVLRTATPLPNAGHHCAHYTSASVGPSTNLGLMTLNRIMRNVAAGKGSGDSDGKNSQSQLSVPSVPVFDGWMIEMPRYLDNCPYGNRHYSCFYAPHFWSRQPNAAGGVVGEAVVRGLIHFMLHEL